MNSQQKEFFNFLFNSRINMSQKKSVHRNSASRLYTGSNKRKSFNASISKPSDNILMWSNTNKSYNEEFVVRRPSSARSNTSAKIISNNKSSLSTYPEKPKNSKLQNTEKENAAVVQSIVDLSARLEIKNENVQQPLEVSCQVSDEFDSSMSETESPTENTIDQYLKNHHCPNCENLMINEHKPLIVYPCGHTFCSVCLEKTKSCSTCKVTISSLQHNVTLETVILNYIDERQKKLFEEKQKVIKKYLTEIANVDARCEVLQGEASSIISSMEILTEDIFNTETNIESLKKKADLIKFEMEKLQSKLSNCESEHKAAIKHHEILEGKYEQNKKQLIMIEKTIKSLQSDKESIKEMIEDLQPGYFSDSDEDVG